MNGGMMFGRLMLLGLIGWALWRAYMRYWLPQQSLNEQASPPQQPGDGVQELFACPRCQTWRTADNRQPCDRADCPYR